MAYRLKQICVKTIHEKNLSKRISENPLRETTRLIATAKETEVLESQCKFSWIQFVRKCISKAFWNSIFVYLSFLHKGDILHAHTLLFISVLLANLSGEISAVAVITRAGHIYEERTRLEDFMFCSEKIKTTNDHINVFQKRIHRGTAWLPRILCSLCFKLRNTGKVCSIGQEKHNFHGKFQ